MRFLFSILTAFITAALCFILDTRAVLKLPLGSLLSPQEGIWQNAEPVNYDFSGNVFSAKLKGKTDVYFDERLVPHVFSEHETDAYFVQGFLHAKFRLWQMELQTFAAAGRASELIGDAAIMHDREFRRLGIVYAAENCRAEMEKDPQTKSACDAYTAGVNEYIKSLTKSSLPIEFKLLGIQPELWTNLKSALFLKYMSYDLSGHENDFEMTAAKAYFSKEDFDKLFPPYQDSSLPVIPKDSAYPLAKVHPVAPAHVDSLYFNYKKVAFSEMPQESHKPNPQNGSNNWAVSGIKTKNGAPILCNDPHLGLNLPSLWFEMQISVPGSNAYGVSFPGAPGIIIGYNDSCAFGFTNGGRDVRDYYEITFKDNTKSEYWFDSSWHKTSQRIECIKVSGKPDVYDTVAYTLFGPVMYDASYTGKKNAKGNFAVRWSAHDNSNEFKFFYLLNRAKNYSDYAEASKYLCNPGQNVVFAAKNGDIALRTAGNFPAKWQGQGDFVMPGIDSSYFWQGMIPQDETPYQYNPSCGFVSSANQRQADTSYPYYLGRDYPSSRGRYVKQRLSLMENITPKDMMALQLSNHNAFAEMALPVLFRFIQSDKLNGSEKSFYRALQQWNFENEAASVNATVFDLTWKAFYDTVFNDEYGKAPQYAQKPLDNTLIESIIKDSAFSFIDNINSIQQETVFDMSTAAFKKAVSLATNLQAENKLEWAVYKDTRIDYLLKLSPFSRLHLPVGGCSNALNAITTNHGPSWRMIVSLSDHTEAYGIYPGGQSGNPGSRFYDVAVDDWVDGNYYSLWLMKKEEKNDSRIKWKLHFNFYD